VGCEILGRDVVSPEGPVSAASTDALCTQSYRERLPEPALTRLLACVWVQQVSADGPAYEHRTVPNGCIEVACVRGAEHAYLIGPRRTASIDCCPAGTTVVGVRFRPGVSAAVLGATAPEIVDLTVGLEDLWGRAATGVAERIAVAATVEEAAQTLEWEIVARCAGAPGLDAAVAEMVTRLQPWQPGGVTELASAMYISPRQLRRRCIAALGYGPKALHRILRFQGFLALTQAFHGRDVGLGWLAAAAGYFDQAHLTHECVALTGVPPAQFLHETRASCGPNHDHAASFAGPRRALVRTRVASLDELTRADVADSYKSLAAARA